MQTCSTSWHWSCWWTDWHWACSHCSLFWTQPLSVWLIDAFALRTVCLSFSSSVVLFGGLVTWSKGQFMQQFVCHLEHLVACVKIHSEKFSVHTNPFFTNCWQFSQFSLCCFQDNNVKILHFKASIDNTFVKQHNWMAEFEPWFTLWHCNLWKMDKKGGHSHCFLLPITPSCVTVHCSDHVTHLGQSPDHKFVDSQCLN